ncbi:MAG: hypothetical protein WBW31_11470, partial [Candidatus Sulfotelmatobacter sp.]
QVIPFRPCSVEPNLESHRRARTNRVDASIETAGATWPAKLNEAHRGQLIESSIASEVVLERGYYSTTDRAHLKSLGFADFQIPKSGSALVIPLWNVRG